MALLSKTIIYIDGNEVPTFNHLFLNQQIDAHHMLEVVFRMDMFENDSSELGEKSKEFLGKTIAVQIGSVSENSNMGVLEFKGIVTQIKIIKGGNTGAGDEIKVSAKSPTILFDDGPHYDSYGEKSLSQVVDSTLQPYEIDNDIAPRYGDTIDYCVQQNESGFTFISRLAAQYGEWFYYNGAKLIFGKPETEEIELKYSIDLHYFEISLAPSPQNHNYYTNDYLTDKVEENDEQLKPSGTSSINGFLFDKSADIFEHQTTIWNNNNNSPQAVNKLKAKVKSEHEGIVIKQVTLKGSSSNPGVKLGNLIKIESEKYRVVSVYHTTDRNGHYQNNFEAISGGFEAYPKTNINAFPKSSSQIAVVKENHDPDAMGRIRVQFPWQVKDNKMTPWIRVLALHAGGGKGFYSIPETGEEVLIDFEGNNAEVPYAAGCLFNANAKPPGNSSSAGNDNTIFRTRSGCTLTLNDGDGSIKLEDMAGSMILLDGTGNIVISAVENFNIDCKVAAFDARETLNVGSPDTTIGGDDFLWLTSDTEVKTGGETTGTITLAGTANVNMSAPEVVIDGATSATLKGGNVDINGTGMTNVKGGTVNLN